MNKRAKNSPGPGDSTRQRIAILPSTRRLEPIRTPTFSESTLGVWVVSIALALGVLAVFGQCVNHDFVNYDDFDYVLNTPQVTGGLTLANMWWFVTHGHVGNWHPLTSYSHMLDCQLFGLNPAGHHFTSVLLHAVTVVLLFHVLRAYTGAFWTSAGVAAAFAIHPLRAESVAWVSTRKDVLSGVFFMLVLWSYLRFVRGAFSWKRYALVLVFYFLGLASKPTLVAVPLVLLLLDHWPLKRVRGGPEAANAPQPKEPDDGAIRTAGRLQLVTEKIPLLAITVACCVVTLVTQRESMHILGPVPLQWRLANALVATVTYLRMIVAPLGLVPLYLHPLDTLPRASIVWAGAVFAAITTIAIVFRKKHPYVLLGWLWYLVVLAPVSGLIQVGRQSHADRYTYLSQIGLCLGAAWLLRSFFTAFPRVRPFGIAGMGVLLSAWMGAAYVQASHWRNSETLWKHTIECGPPNNIAYENLGAWLGTANRHQEAIPYLQRGLELHATSTGHNNIGFCYRALQRNDLAIFHIEKALELDPTNAPAHLNLGNTLAERGDNRRALADLEAAVKYKPDYFDALQSIGYIHLIQREFDAAVEALKKADHYRPNEKLVLGMLVEALQHLGRRNEARDYQYKLVECENRNQPLSPRPQQPSMPPNNQVGTPVQ